MSIELLPQPSNSTTSPCVLFVLICRVAGGLDNGAIFMFRAIGNIDEVARTLRLDGAFIGSNDL
jgi:hypothetical protein